MSMASFLPSINAFPAGGVVTVGNFDGVHLGHRRMISHLIAMARQLNTRARAITFDPPPLAIVAPDRVPPQLSTISSKITWLKDCGVDEVIVCPTTRELLDLPAEEFFEKILVGQLGCLGIVEGPNFCFGRGRVGDVALLRTLCARRNIPLEIVAAEAIDGLMVSSSGVRAALGAGDVRLARTLLGRPYAVTGRVEQGASRGRQLGFPTANLHRIETLLPPPGVYAGLCRVDDGVYPVAMNIGPNPTFGENQLKVEAHLVGYHGDLYGRDLSIELLDRLRGVVKFSGIESLQQQLQLDIARSIECAAAVRD